MRKVFGGSLVFSLVGVALLGGIFAWTLSDSVDSSNNVGSGDFQLEFNNNGNLLGPDGIETFVGGGGGGFNGDFTLRAGSESGKVTILSVPGNDGTCTVNMFSGRVVVVTPEVIMGAPGYMPGDWEYTVWIRTNGDGVAAPLIPANVECMGETVNYRITVDAETVGVVGNVPAPANP